jgi:dTDP-glucose pyrophosphorylase
VVSQGGPLVCIIAAGRGTRMGFADGALHKALAPLSNRAVLSHVVESFPDDARFVVAVGHLADQVKTYMSLAHHDRDVRFVEVDNYAGPGSGPGLSVLACAEALGGEPFALAAADGVVHTMPPLSGETWMGASPVGDPTSYLTLDTGPTGDVRALQERTGPSHLAYNGVSWIAEPEAFFAGLRRGVVAGELQVTQGFQALLDAGVRVRAPACDWTDAGTTETYAAARRVFAEYDTAGRSPIDVTYLLPDRVVKWFRDPAGADVRAQRAAQLDGAIPEIIPSPSGWLAYAKAPGSVLCDKMSAEEVGAVLDFTSRALWRPGPDDAEFRAAARRFYGDKTLGRLAKWLADRGLEQEPPSGWEINGLATPTVAEGLAAELDGLVDAAVPTVFHGDMHEGNIVAGPGGYALIDWRDEFGGLTDRGDLLYDLAKLLHSLELPESVMHARTFRREAAGERGVTIEHPDAPLRAEARAALWAWCDGHGFDARAIGVVDALIWINMAPLYDRALGDYLYAWGRWLLEVRREAAVPEAELMRRLRGTPQTEA